ncbi:MAG TPA: hypothetical protein VFV38_16835 [Ktedonobacteraceae bacterium]|nr:hypothetical protein [Ktedonobacteraceae bacterium]
MSRQQYTPEDRAQRTTGIMQRPTSPSPGMAQRATGHREVTALPATGEAGVVPRKGVLGWWLNLTAPKWPSHTIPIAERERLRKAELTSFSILAIMAFLIALVSNSLADPATAQAVGLLAVFMTIAAILNRTGHTKIAAYLVPGIFMLVAASAVLQGAGGLRPIGFPIYDLMVVPILLVALTGDRRAPWIFAAIGIAFVVVSFLEEKHAIIQVAPGVSFDEINYEVNIFGIWGVLNRHIALIFFAAFFSWLGARSVDLAIIRADRAEEIARLEHAYAEQSMQLEQGIRQIQETHIKVANGDFNARAPLGQEHILWQIANALNNLIQRMQRSAQAEHTLRRTETEVARLLEEIQRAKAGQIPVWPQPSGTPLDPIIAEFSQLRARGGD